MVIGEDPAKRRAVVRCHPTHSDHHRGHGRSKHGAARLGDRSARFPFSEQLPTFRQSGTKAHINVRETFALQEVLKPATTTHPGCLKGSTTTVVEVDNKAMHDVLKKRHSRNVPIYDLITELFWL